MKNNKYYLVLNFSNPHCMIINGEFLLWSNKTYN